MKHTVFEYAERFLKDKKKRRRLIAIVCAVCMFVAYSVTNMLIMPGISMTDGDIRLSVVGESSALTGKGEKLLVKVEARASRNSNTRFVLKTDANGADLSDLYTFTRTEITDAEGNFRNADGTLRESDPAAYQALILDDKGNEMTLTRANTEEKGIVEYSFVVPRESQTSFTLQFAEGKFAETVEERGFAVQRPDPQTASGQNNGTETAANTETSANTETNTNTKTNAETAASGAGQSETVKTNAIGGVAVSNTAQKAEEEALDNTVVEAAPAEGFVPDTKDYDPAEMEAAWMGESYTASAAEVTETSLMESDGAAGETPAESNDGSGNDAAAAESGDGSGNEAAKAQSGTGTEPVENPANAEGTDVTSETQVHESVVYHAGSENEITKEIVPGVENSDEAAATEEAAPENPFETYVETEPVFAQEEAMTSSPSESGTVSGGEAANTAEGASVENQASPFEAQNAAGNEGTETQAASGAGEAGQTTVETEAGQTAGETEAGQTADEGTPAETVGENEAAELELIEKRYTLSFEAAVTEEETPAPAEEEEETEASVVSDIIIITGMEYLNGDTTPLAGEPEPTILSWLTKLADEKEGTTDRHIVEQSSFFNREIEADIFEDGTYRDILEDDATITIEGSMPSDVVAFAYPIYEEQTAPVDVPAVDGEGSTEDTVAVEREYEVVVTYDIALFRSYDQVRFENGDLYSGEADNRVIREDKPVQEEVGFQGDRGSVDESVIVSVNDVRYVKYEPSEGNFLKVTLSAPQLAQDNGNDYSVMRGEEDGEKEMETVPSDDPTEGARSVTFYTDHFTPFSVVREKNNTNLIWFDPVNGTPGSWTNKNGDSRSNPTSSWGWVIENAKHYGTTVVFMNTYEIDYSADMPYEPGGTSAIGKIVRCIRDYDLLNDPNATINEGDIVDGFRGALFRIKSGADVTFRNFDINGSGVNATEPLVILEDGAKLTLDNCYLHHGYNIADPKNADGKNEFANGVFGRGGAINMSGGAELVMGSSTIEHCKAMHGGGIYSKGADNKITLNDKASVSNNDVNNDFSTSYQGGGKNVVHQSTGKGTASGQVVYYQPRMGGGIALYDGSLTINDGAAIDKNGAFYGGGVYAEGAAKVTMNGGSVSNNKTGAMIENGKRVTGDDPNTVYSPYSQPAGGGIMFANATYIDPDGYGKPNIRRISAGNRSAFNNVDGAVIYASHSNAERPRAGGKYSFTMTGGSIDNNTNYGFEGGGVIFSPREVEENWSCAAYNTNNLPTASISGGSISGNKTKRIGGGIYCGWVDLTIIADEGKVVKINNNETVGMSDLEQRVDRFQTGYNGGGMFIYAGSKVRIYDALVTQNTTTHVNDWTDVETRSAGNKYMRGDGQWNGGGGIASCKTSVTKFNNNRGVAVFDNTIAQGVSTKLDGSTGQSYAHGTDLMLVAESQSAGDSLDYYHNTYMAIDMTGGGENVFTFDNVNQVSSQYYKDKIPEHEQYMPHGTAYASQNILPVKLLDGNDGLSIQVLNHPTEADKELAHAEARVQFIGNIAYTKGGGIANNGELVFGANSHAIQLFKVDGENPSTFLSGAIFTLTKVRETRDVTEIYSISKQAPADGKIVFWDLAEGKYNITETVAPQGFTARAKVWQIWVRNDGIYQNMNGKWIKLDSEKELGPMDPDTGVTPQLFTLRDDDNEKTIKNYQSEMETKVTVNKSWLDEEGNPLPDDRKQEVTIELYGGPSLAEQNGLGQTVVLNAENNWTASFENLPVFWGNEKDGIACVYTVKEVEMEAFSVAETFHEGKWVKTDKFEFGKLYVLVRDGGGALSGKTNAEGAGLTGSLNVGEDKTFDPATTTLEEIDKNAVWTVSKNQTSAGGVAYRLKTLGDGRILGSEPNGTFRKASIQTSPDGSGFDAVQIVDGKTLTFNDTWKFCIWQNGEGFRLRTSGGTPSVFSLYYWDSGVTTVTGTEGSWTSVSSLEPGKPYVFTMPYVNKQNQVAQDNNLYWTLIFDRNFFNGHTNDYNRGYGIVAVERFDVNKIGNGIQWIPEDAGNGYVYLRTDSVESGTSLYMAADSHDAALLYLTLNKNNALRVKRLSDGALQIGDGTQYMSIGIPDYAAGSVQPVYENLPQVCKVKIIPGTFTIPDEIMGYQYDVTNTEKPGYVMPATGGMGTHWIYFAGFALLALVGIGAWRRRLD